MLRLPTESLPQRLIITLLADYRDIVGGPFASRVVVEVLNDLDVTTEAARSALARLVQRGVLVRTKAGRETSYDFSELGLAEVEEDRTRILGFGSEREWDGMWTVVVFSIAESEKHKRYVGRARLRALGLAPMYDGVWISAYATPEAAAAALAQVEITDSSILRASFFDAPTRLRVLQEKWEVDELRDDYEHFISLFGPLAAEAERGSLSLAESLASRLQLMDDWRTFPRREPDLPPDFLPDGWPVVRAREIFQRSYSALRPAAETRLRTLLER